MSIRDNIAFGIKLFARLKRSELDGKVEEAFGAAALWDEVGHQLNANGLSLSGGRAANDYASLALSPPARRLFCSMALFGAPPNLHRKIETLIDELSKDYTIAIVTHNMEQAMRVSDFAAFMYLGELLEFADTDTLFTSPRHKTTERYITGRFG